MLGVRTRPPQSTKATTTSQGSIVGCIESPSVLQLLTLFPKSLILSEPKSICGVLIGSLKKVNFAFSFPQGEFFPTRKGVNDD